MRLRFWRRDCHDPQAAADARAAVVHANRQMADTDKFSERVDEVTSDIARVKGRNHIAEAIAAALRGGA